MTSPPARLAILVAVSALITSCGSGSIANETRLIEVHGGRAYLCLSNAINDSMPPSCGGAAVGTRDNPQLHGPMVPELLLAMKGVNQFVELSASEEDGEWLLQKYAAPE